ncbi:MAG: hypothetical protein K2I49_02380 [Ureaplasma sp.]|nr:hypothetical protein [Ureaplasma sp.]
MFSLHQIFSHLKHNNDNEPTKFQRKEIEPVRIGPIADLLFSVLLGLVVDHGGNVGLI